MTLFRMLLITSVWGLSAKHVYIETRMTWLNAQQYCRLHHTDLSSISRRRDHDLINRTVYRHLSPSGWIGLYRDPENITGWKWSGGSYAFYEDWANGQPNNYGGNEFYVAWTRAGWRDHGENIEKPFFCLNLIVMKEEKTWEEALEHCREHHTDLISLVSETEVLLAQREIQKTQTVDRVWIGLSFLGNRWMWMNSDRLKYEAWTPGGGQHMCPRWSHSCGALTKEGLWENHNCQEKLYFICY